MSEELKEKLKADVDDASWELLADHHKRGAVFLVKDADIVEVGVAMATDDSAKVKIWLDNGNFLKVDDEMAKDYAKDAKAKNFEFLIVQPYVLIKLK